MVSPTPPEHHAESAYCPDHIVDANKMVSAGLPSEEETARVLIAHFVENTGFQTVNEDDSKTSVSAYYGGHWVDLRIYPIARAILALIRPAFEAKEMEIAYWRCGFEDQRKQRSDAERISNGWEDYGNRMQTRARSAEAKLREANMQALSDEGQVRDLSAKLAQAVEALEPFAKLAEAFDKAAEKFGRPLRPDGYIPSVQVSYGDLRRARAAARGEKT